MKEKLEASFLAEKESERKRKEEQQRLIGGSGVFSNHNVTALFESVLFGLFSIAKTLDVLECVLEKPQ